MPTLQISIEIAAEPLSGHRHHKLEAAYGPTDGAVLSRIVAANQGSYGPLERPVDIALKAVAAAVAAAE